MQTKTPEKCRPNKYPDKMMKNETMDFYVNGTQLEETQLSSDGR